MTQSELEEYNRLTSEQKDFYNMAKRMHPEWSHRQCHTYAVICSQDPFGDGNGGDLSPMEVFRVMIRQADIYMETNFPNIYPQVKETFRNVYNYVKSAVSTTWDTIVNFFKNL